MGLRSRVKALERESMWADAATEPQRGAEFWEACERTQAQLDADAVTLNQMRQATARMAVYLFRRANLHERAKRIGRHGFDVLNAADMMRLDVERQRCLLGFEEKG